MKKMIWVIILLAGIFLNAGISEAAMSAQEFVDLCAKGTPHEVETAIKNGADVNAKDSNGGDWTALMSAADNPNTEVIALLLKRGADINAEDNDGWTALMYAAKYGNTEVIVLLLKSGADARIEDSGGKRAIDHARENDNLKGTEAFKQLQKASGATTNATKPAPALRTPIQKPATQSINKSNPFEVHKGGFGPTIKNIQIGMPVTVSSMIAIGSQIGFPFTMGAHNGHDGRNSQNIDNIAIDFGVKGKQITGWNIRIIRGSLQKAYLEKLKLEELFEVLKEKGLVEWMFSGDGMINTRNGRIVDFSVGIRAFNAQSMSLRDFAQALANAYPLGTLKGDGNKYISQNFTEGWQVKIDQYFIEVSPITIPGNFDGTLRQDMTLCQTG